jgi:hypothetical protein
MENSYETLAPGARVTVARCFRDTYNYSDNEYNPQDDIRHVGRGGSANRMEENLTSLRAQAPLRDSAVMRLV